MVYFDLDGCIRDLCTPIWGRQAHEWNEKKDGMGLITGSYLRTYAPGFTGYGEVKAYSPTTLGATRARYIPCERILTVENRADNVGLKGQE